MDIRLAEQLARLEAYNKHLYRPNTYLHKWWARRCGSTFRLILKALVEDPARRDYYAPGGLEGKVILDPMLGGGTTLHEAVRLGASVIGADIDPIPVLQARATLSQLPLTALETGFARLHGRLREALAPSFGTRCPSCAAAVETQFTLYGARRRCACGPRVVVDSTVLRWEDDGSAVRLCPQCLAVGTGDAGCACEPGAAPARVAEKETGRCPRCGAAFEEDAGLPFYRRYVAIAVAARCPAHGRFLASPGEDDRERLAAAEGARDRLGFRPEEFAIRPGPKSGDLLRRGVRSYLDLFSSRQLLYLRHAVDALSECEPLLRLNLALLVSTSLEFNAMLCGYKGGNRWRPGAIRHVFSHHAYSFPYTALENNPVYPAPTSGTLQALFAARIRRARQWAQQPAERVPEGSPPTRAIMGEVDAGEEVERVTDLCAGPRRFMLVHGSSAALALPDESVDHVVTDPPYFDSVQYGDLAAFFHAWLRQLVPGAAAWDYDLDDAAVDSGGAGEERYAAVLGAIFAECRRVLRKPEGRLIFTFHHWSPRGWAALTRALRRAGFRLWDCQVVHAENPASVHVVNQKALTHDAILTLAPPEAGAGPVWARPTAVDRSDSAAFCQDCGSVLGSLLGGEPTELEIERAWGILLWEDKRASTASRERPVCPIVEAP